MEWLSDFTASMMFVVLLNWFVINRSYHVGKEKRFKSKYHRLFDKVVSVVTMVLAILIVIKWIFF